MRSSRNLWMETICDCPGRAEHRPTDCQCPDPPCHFCAEPLLSDGELVVHHLDHDRTNNSLQNLVGAHNGCHRKHHVSGGTAEPEKQSDRILRALHHEVCYTFHTFGMTGEQFARVAEEFIQRAAEYAGQSPKSMLSHPLVAQSLRIFEGRSSSREENIEKIRNIEW